jgi:hypothetical protein
MYAKHYDEIAEAELKLANAERLKKDPNVLIGKSVTFWPSLDQGGGKWGRAELLRSNSTML